MLHTTLGEVCKRLATVGRMFCNLMRDAVPSGQPMITGPRLSTFSLYSFLVQSASGNCVSYDGRHCGFSFSFSFSFAVVGAFATCGPAELYNCWMAAGGGGGGTAGKK
jgi:hypothetical protein